MEVDINIIIDAYVVHFELYEHNTVKPGVNDTHRRFQSVIH